MYHKCTTKPSDIENIKIESILKAMKNTNPEMFIQATKCIYKQHLCKSTYVNIDCTSSYVDNHVKPLK